MTSGTTFGARLHAAVRARGPLCAGIDPHAALLHEWGLEDSVAGLERFALVANDVDLFHEGAPLTDDFTLVTVRKLR